jgi:hypothetical protein
VQVAAGQIGRANLVQSHLMPIFAAPFLAYHFRVCQAVAGRPKPQEPPGGARAPRVQQAARRRLLGIKFPFFRLDAC